MEQKLLDITVDIHQDWIVVSQFSPQKKEDIHLNSNNYRNISAPLAKLATRIAHLMRQLSGSENTQSARFAEVENRIGAMTNAVEAINAHMNTNMQDTRAMREESQLKFNQAGNEVAQGLLTLEQSLSEKLSKVSEVVVNLQRIGKELELIAVNAAIQAAHAGEAGRSFSVVADHVKELAQRAIKDANVVAHMLDLSDLQQQLIGFGRNCSDNVSEVNAETDKTFEHVYQTYHNIQQSMDQMIAHGKVIEATHHLDKTSAQAQQSLVSWAAALAQDMAESAHKADPAEYLRKLLHKDGANPNVQTDRLKAIRERGFVRVAIEPAFKGLSFRMRSGEPLRGLDVEYATAFAKHLGVKVQFIEHPWDQCTNLLHLGRKRGEPEADLVWSALPPSSSYYRVAYSEPYTYLHYLLARRKGDTRITGLNSLQGKVLGCINDPGAFATLEAAGIRWSKHSRAEPGTIQLSNLIAYTDQSLIHDAVANGTVDAFAVDQPIFAWACKGHDSPWNGKIELLNDNIASGPWYYAVAVADDPANYTLLHEINAFIQRFKSSREREQIEQRWQFNIVNGNSGYQNESGDLRGEAELYEEWSQLNQ